MRSPRCQQVVERSFDSWNDPEQNRRYRQMKLVLDVPSDEEPVKRTRSAKTEKPTSSSGQSSEDETDSEIEDPDPDMEAIKCNLFN